LPINPRFPTGINDNMSNMAPVDDHAVKRGIAIYDKTDILPGLSNFIGQSMAIKQINLAIASAHSRGTRLDHTLLASGLAGIGKSTLARHIAYEMGVGIVECSGRISAEDVMRLAVPMRDGDILFIDECHSIGKGNSSAWILPLLQDGHILTPSGPVEIADITIVAATTDQGKLSEAILSRFVVKPRLVHYELDEAAAIVEQFAEKMMLVNLSLDDCERIAEAANLNPRKIKALVSVARDLNAVYGTVDMDELFDLTGVTPDGLDEDAQGYLRALSGCTNYQASKNTLSAILSEPSGLDHIEKDLLGKGLIEVFTKGRKLTAAGVQRTKMLK
jgi:Holliday junction resolvasome RuvABC ATP-dependent DNA helicase subunit